LACVGFRERAAEDGEVLREDKNQAAFDASVTGDEAVAKDLLLFHPEVCAVVGDQLVGLFEGALVEQELDTLTGRHLARVMLFLLSLRASALLSEFVSSLQLGQFFFEVHSSFAALRI